MWLRKDIRDGEIKIPENENIKDFIDRTIEEDGCGKILATYDGKENIYEYDGKEYYIFRLI